MCIPIVAYMYICEFYIMADARGHAGVYRRAKLYKKKCARAQLVHVLPIARFKKESSTYIL